MLTLPDNPTGTLAGAVRVAEVCAVAREHDLVIVADEIYRDLLHDATVAYVSPAELAPERTVVTTGLSKSLAVGGWRTGVARLPQGPLGRRLHDRPTEIASEVWSSAPMPIQHAAAWAFREPPSVRERIAASRRVCGTITRAVADRFRDAGAHVAPVAGGFYLAPDLGPTHEATLAARHGITTGSHLAARLLEHHGFATLPIGAFGSPDGVLRLRVATSLLCGDDEAQRHATLAATDPTALPWVAGHLDAIEDALGTLLAT